MLVTVDCHGVRVETRSYVQLQVMVPPTYISNRFFQSGQEVARADGLDTLSPSHNSLQVILPLSELRRVTFIFCPLHLDLSELVHFLFRKSHVVLESLLEVDAHFAVRFGRLLGIRHLV